MAAPSKSFTVIPDTDIDPDSPLTTGLFTDLRDNDIHLEEWLGLSYTAAQDHDHDGVNSKLVSLKGENFDPPTHQYEIFDHFLLDLGAEVDSSVWEILVANTVTISDTAHYTTGKLGSKMKWRHANCKVILEWRCKAIGTVTRFGSTFEMGADGTGAVGAAMFRDKASPADEIDARTLNGAGNTSTAVPIGGGGVDAWHIYRIDMTSATNTKYYVDTVLVADHARIVDNDVLFLSLDDAASGGHYDYARLWVASIDLSA